MQRVYVCCRRPQDSARSQERCPMPFKSISHGGLGHVKWAYDQIRVHVLIYILDLSSKSAR